MVKVVQIYVCKKLACKISDRYSPLSPEWLKQIVSFEIVYYLLLLIAVGDNCFYEREGVFTFYLSLNLLKKDFMVYAGKVFLYITLKHIPIFSAKLCESIHCLMCPFVFSAGIGIKDKGLFKDWLYNIAQGVMNNPVPVRRCAYLSRFSLIDGKFPVFAGNI